MQATNESVALVRSFLLGAVSQAINDGVSIDEFIERVADYRGFHTISSSVYPKEVPEDYVGVMEYIEDLDPLCVDIVSDTPADLAEDITYYYMNR